MAELLAIDEENKRRLLDDLLDPVQPIDRLLDDLLGSDRPPPLPRARRLLKARRRWHERRLADLSRKVDWELDRLDRIDLELTGSPPVIIWGKD